MTYRCNLPPNLLDKAVKELNEPFDGVKRLEAINEVRLKFKERNPQLQLDQDGDAFLLRFLRARKFDVERTLEILTNYHTKRNEWPEVFDKLKNPALMSDTLNAGVVVPLQGWAKDGSKVVLCRLGFEENTVVENFYAAVFLTMETLLKDEKIQISGITIIQDLAYLSMDVAKQMSPMFARRFTNVVQNVLPLRVKSVNITNEPKIFDFVFAIIKPFLSDKLRGRIRFHGTDFSTLYEIIDKSELPLMFAGSGPEYDVQEWKKQMMADDTAL